MLSRRPVNRREWTDEEREHLVDVSVGRAPLASLLPDQNVRCNGCGVWVKRGDPSAPVRFAPAEWCRWCEGMRSRRARELKRDLWEE